MSSIIEPNFSHCIESLSCSPLLYINIQRFLSKKNLFKGNEKKRISQEKVAYQHICEKYFLHQDEIVRNHIKDICGEEIFEEEKIFSSEIPYTKEHHSFFSDLVSSEKGIAPVTFKQFQEAMKQKIYPFRYGNLGDSKTTGLSGRIVFLSVLANCFLNALAVIRQDPIVQSKSKPTWFRSHFKDTETPELFEEWALTTSLLNKLECKSSMHPKEYMDYFIKLYFWNRISLVADAFLKNEHRFKRKLLYPNYLWLIFIKDNGLPRKNQNDIIDDIENELFAPWTHSIYCNLVQCSDSSDEYIDSSIKIISEFCDSAIPSIMDEYIVAPLTKNWGKCDFPKHRMKDTKKINLYKNKINNIIEHLHRKDKYAYSYFPSTYLLEDVLKINNNPFLYFHECAGQIFTDVSKATTKQLLTDYSYRFSCPLQVLQLPNQTLQGIFSNIKKITKEFHTYLRNNIKSKSWHYDFEDIKLPYNDTKMDKLCKVFYEQISEEETYRLDSDDIAPLYDKYYYAWIYYAALYLKERFFDNSYKAYCKIVETKDDVDPLLGASDLELLFNNISASILKTNTKKQNPVFPPKIKETRNEIFKLINQGDHLFNNLNSKRTMVKYCNARINERHFYVTLFFWWICGYINYIKKGIILKKEENYELDDNGRHNKIKRIGLPRLYNFQKRTCELTQILGSLEKRSRPKTNRNEDSDKLDILYKLMEVDYNPIVRYVCSEGDSEKCCNSIQNIAKGMLKQTMNF